MRKKHFIVLICCFLSLGSSIAQTEQLRAGVYPAPKMTPEAAKAIASARSWNAPMTRSAVVLPEGVDNSKLKYFPEIFNQIGGSCAQSSGIRYLFTYEMNALLDRTATKSNTFSYFYTWNFLNDGIDQGGFAEQGLDLARFNGAMTIGDFPDQTSAYSFSWPTGYDKYINAMHYRAREILTFPLTTEADILALKRYLYDRGNGSDHGGIVSFSAQSSDWKFDNYYSGPSVTGYRSLLTKLATTGAHAMTIVGYDDLVEFTPDGGEKTTGAFIVANSYGTFYHDNGRYYLPYYFFLQSRPSMILSTDATGVVPENHEPKIVFKVKVDYNSRNDLSFSLGVANKPYAESPTVTFVSNIANYQGGDYPMTGQYANNNKIEIAFNFTDQLSKFESFTEPKYFLTVNKMEKGKIGQGTIQYFSVVDYRGDVPKEYVCKDINNNVLKAGANMFSVATTQAVTTSASSLKWLNNGTPAESPFVVRLANGKYAKIQFQQYDKTTGRVTIKYLYQPDGSRNLNSNQ